MHTRVRVLIWHDKTLEQNHNSKIVKERSKEKKSTRSTYTESKLSIETYYEILPLNFIDYLDGA